MTVNQNEAVPAASPELLPVLDGREAECLWVICELMMSKATTVGKAIGGSVGFSPSLKEIGEQMGLSESRALHYVERLEASGVLRRERGEGKRVERSIEVDWKKLRAVGNR